MTKKEFDNMTPTEQMAYGLLAAKHILDEQEAKIRELNTQINTLTAQNEDMKLKAEYFDRLVEENLLTDLKTTANDIGLSKKEFIGFLIKNGYIQRDDAEQIQLVATMNDGLFEIRYRVNPETRQTSTQTMVTPRGRETFRLLCRGLKE